MFRPSLNARRPVAVFLTLGVLGTLVSGTPSLASSTPGPAAAIGEPATFLPAPNPVPYCDAPTYFDPYTELVNAVDAGGNFDVDHTFDQDNDGDPTNDTGQRQSISSFSATSGGKLALTGTTTVWSPPRDGVLSPMINTARAEIGILVFKGGEFELSLSQPLFYSQWVFTDIDLSSEGFEVEPMWMTSHRALAGFGGNANFDFTGSNVDLIDFHDTDAVDQEGNQLASRVQVDALGGVTGFRALKTGDGGSGVTVGGGCMAMGVSKETTDIRWDAGAQKYSVDYAISIQNNLPTTENLNAKIAAAQAAAAHSFSSGEATGIPVLSVQLTDELESAGFSRVEVASLITDGDLPLNPGYNGSTDTEMLAAGATLPPEDFETLTLTVDYHVDRSTSDGSCPALSLDNQVKATGTAGGMAVSDISDSGSDADPGSDNGGGTTNDPLAVNFPSIDCSSLTVSKSANTPDVLLPSPDGTVDLSYTIEVSNASDVDMTTLPTDDLAAAFGTGAVISGVSLDATGVCDGLENPSFGIDDSNLLTRAVLLKADPAQGCTFNLSFTLDPDPSGAIPATYTNTAQAEGFLTSYDENGDPFTGSSSVTSTDLALTNVSNQLYIVSGTVTSDTDDDDAGDAPLSGVTIELHDAAGNVVATTTTADDGTYSFEDVGAGDYTVTQTDQPGYVSVSDVDGENDNSIAVTLNGSNVADRDFVDEPGLMITGSVYSDSDGDAAPNSTLQGVTIQLKDADGNVIATTTTDADGTYSFGRLLPGSYTVTETDPSDYDSVSDVDGANDNTITVELVDSSISGQDFVDEPVATIFGSVSEDTNGDGTPDGTLEGVTIQLNDADGNVVATTTTAADGSYSFPNQPPGDYTITETDPNGYGSVSDADGANDNTIAVTLTGTDVDGRDFVDHPLAAISGSVQSDTNGDSTPDGTLEGVTVELSDASGNVIATTTTAADGSYSFENLPPADYTITETDLSGYDSVSDVDGANDNTIAVTLTGTAITGRDFVDEPLAAISGTVRSDDDGDGTPEATVGSVTITLRDADGNDVATTTTAEDGSYRFESLPPGDYTITETDQFGYDSVSDVDGANDNTIAASLTGSDITDQDFVDEPGLVISGSVQSDTDGDGNADSTVEGVTIELRDPDGNVIATTTTAEDGSYRFERLHTGDYTVTETDPDGYDSVSDSDGGNDNTIAVELGDSDVANQNFVDEPLATLSGSVRSDANSDGNADGSVGGVTIELRDVDGTVIATTTAEDGSYSFPNLPPGEYTITETDPDGYNSVSDADGENDNTIRVTLTGTDMTDLDFIDEKFGAIAGSVGEDTDGDGTADGPVEGVTIELSDTDGNVIATTTTAEDGSYHFSEVVPGDYTITEIDLGGYTSVSDVDGENDNIIAVNVSADETVTGQDFLDDPPDVTADVDLNNKLGESVTVDLLANDDPATEADMLSLIDPGTGHLTDRVEIAGEGVWELDDNGMATFTPEAGFEGDPTPITYRADYDNSDAATATIVVTYLPEAIDDAAAGNKLGDTVTVDVLENDAGDLDPSSIRIIHPTTGEPVEQLTVPDEGVWSIDPATGEITFTPEAGFADNPTPITYQAHKNDCDAEEDPYLNCTPVNADVRVTYVPEAEPDSLTGLPAGSTAQLKPLGNDDGHFDVSSLRIIDPATGEGVLSLAVFGEGIWRVDPATGTLTFEPEPGFDGDPTPIGYMAHTVDGAEVRSTVTLSYERAATTTATTTPTTDPAVKPATTATPSTTPTPTSSKLAFTGGSLSAYLATGLALLACGFGLLGWRRRREA